MKGPELRVQVWIDGVEKVDKRISMDNAHFLGKEDVAMVAAAEKAGSKYLVQISDPEGEFEPMRFGSDTNGMVDPIRVTDENWPPEPRWRK